MSLDSIQIDTGVKHVAITDKDGKVTGEISFNPEDALFRDRFFALGNEVETKVKEFNERAETLQDTEGKTDLEIGKERNDLLIEYCDYLDEKIDGLFSDGTAETVFQGTKNFDAYTQFFTGITPFFNAVSDAVLDKYAAPKTSKKRNRSRK